MYSTLLNECNPVSALEALVRDRSEIVVSSPKRSFAAIGVVGNPINPPNSFFSNGPLRSFFACGEKIKIYQERLPEMCVEAIQCDNEEAFIATCLCAVRWFSVNRVGTGCM